MENLKVFVTKGETQMLMEEIIMEKMADILFESQLITRVEQANLKELIHQERDQ